MKIAASRLSSFLNTPDPKVRVFLIYGPDTGLVSERATNLAKKILSDPNDPFCAVTLPSSVASKDPARLFDEMASLSLGGGNRLIKIQNPEESFAGTLNALLADMPASSSFLLIEAGDLEKRSKLRAACESDTPIACGIPCYLEDGAARQRTIADILASEKIKTTKNIIESLSEILPSDRLAMRSELEKFALYVGKENAATLDDVHACLQDAGLAALDDLVFAIGGGEAKRAMQLIDRLYGEQTSPVALLRAAQRHFLRIYWARAEVDKGVSAPDAVKRLQPAVFWKYESAMAAQLRRWTRQRAEQALRRLYDAEAAVKRTGTPDAALCAQTLLGLAA